MNKNALTYILVILIVTAIIFAGYFMIKPNHERVEENPYSMKIDSIGEIAPENYLPTTYTNFKLKGAKALAITVNDRNEILIGIDNTIQRIDNSGNILSKFECDGNATALTFNENKIIAAFENKIRIYEPEGNLLQNWELENPDSYISSVAVAQNTIYAADAQFASVLKYSFEGNKLGIIGQKTDKKDVSFFVVPSYFFDVAADADQNIWVANTGRHKFVQFDTDGQVMLSWGKTSSAIDGFSGCCNPSNFGLLTDKSFITAEKGLVRVKKYSKNGEFEGVLAGPKKFREDTKGLDIAIDQNNIIYVLEPDAMTIHVIKII